nr:MAG TPA: hypothetical protein [Caudoviricetes sp.]
MESCKHDSRKDGTTKKPPLRPSTAAFPNLIRHHV